MSRVLGRDDRRYRATSTAFGLTINNRRQGLAARFTDEDVQVRSGADRLGLTLRAYGYGQALRPVAPAPPRAGGNRVFYRRGSLVEWYENGPLGLEQGFTLRAPPALRVGGALTLSLSLSGNLRVSLTPGRDGLVFATKEGPSSLRYRGLAAFDAGGRKLPAWLELRGRHLRLRVDDRGAQYPLTIDPFVQQAKLTASDGAASNGFRSVAVSGCVSGSECTVVAGAPFATVGANASQGAAYVFVEPAGGWANATETAKLTASDGTGGDELGLSVAVSGGTIVAGAPSPSGPTPNVGDPGAAYVFVRPAGGWANATETAKLTASDGTTSAGAGDGLGSSVAVSGDTIVAGAPCATVHAGFFGPSCGPGAAYAFVQPTGGWTNATETAKLTASDGAPSDGFGNSVAVSGCVPGSECTIVAGAYNASVGGNNSQGAAYVFVQPAGGWTSATQTAKLTASDGAAGNAFGNSVAASGGTVVAGAHFFNGFQGAVYVFVEPAGGWANATQTAKLTASGGTAIDELGYSVAVSGGTIVAGAPQAEGGGGCPGSAAYVFVEPASGWTNATQTAKLNASDGTGLGFSVAVSGSTVVDGGSGAAYVFGPGPAGTSPLCVSLNPAGQTQATSSPATATATVVDANSNPVPGVTVNFSVTSGPNAGTTGNAVTDASGNAAFTYTSSLSGTDTLVATFTDSTGNTHTSNSVTVTWTVSQPSGQPQPIGGPPSPAENPSGGNASDQQLCPAQGSAGDPCNTASGSFSHTFTDFSIPGRGLALNFARTYSSVFAGVNGPLGYGWTGSYNMALTTDPSGSVTVHQENGAQVTFTPGSGGGYTAPPRDTATLVKNGNGSFTFTRGAQQTFSFSDAGKLTKETDLNGYTTAFAYNGDGRLATATDPAGRSLAFNDSGAHIVGIKDPEGRTVAFSYDANGNLASATDVNGGVTRFTYDANHRLLTMTDPRGGVVTNTYDSQGRIVSQTDPLNRTTTYAYSGNNMSASGGTTTITDPKGNVTVEQYQYGLRISLTRGSGTPSAATWSYVYDPATLGITSLTDPNGHVTTKTYDSSGNLLTKTDALGRETVSTYNSFNEVLRVTDPLGVTTTNTYDSQGNLRSISTPIGSSTAKTAFTYGDSAHPGDVTSMTDPNGHTWIFTYDAQGDRASATDPARNKTSYSYNTLGERLTMLSPKGNVAGANPTEFTTTYTYDPFGDVLTATDPLGNKTTNSYDANRNLVRVVDASGNVTTNGYDASNELTTSSRTDPAGQLLQTLATTYDADGNVLTQINGLGIATETYSYDPLNRVTSTTDALGRATTYTYDGAGNTLTLVDPSGGTTSFSYDNANELTAVAYSDGTTRGVTYTYDADGQRLTMTDGTGTTSYTYDALHRLTKDVQGDGHAISYAYDLAGNLTQITYPNGKTVTRTYDTVNRLASVSTWLSPPNTVTFVYDADSNLTTETYPNGVAATFTHDRADRLTSIADAEAGTTLRRFSYTRDGVGLVTAESDRRFDYDGLNRLTSDSLATAAYRYDPANQLTKLTTAATTTTFGYDSANQLSSSTAGAATTTYAYDQQGNRLGATESSGHTTTYTYDQANRLSGFSRGSTTASYAYNGDGLRMSKRVNAHAESFAWDVAEGLPLVLVDGSTSYVTGPGAVPLEQIGAGGSVAFYHQDQLGSTRMLTDRAGAVEATYTYNAYGSLLTSTGSVSQPFRFAGQYTDSESGFVYLRARYYDPTTAQFVSPDPAVSTTRSPYTYVAANPPNIQDPSGLFGLPDLNPVDWWNATGGQVVHTVQNGGLPNGRCIVLIQNNCQEDLVNNIHTVESVPVIGALFRLDPFTAAAFDFAKFRAGEPISALTVGGDVLGFAGFGVGLGAARIAAELRYYTLGARLWNAAAGYGLLGDIVGNGFIYGYPISVFHMALEALTPEDVCG